MAQPCHAAPARSRRIEISGRRARRGSPQGHAVPRAACPGPARRPATPARHSPCGGRRRTLRPGSALVRGGALCQQYRPTAARRQGEARRAAPPAPLRPRPAGSRWRSPAGQAPPRARQGRSRRQGRFGPIRRRAPSSAVAPSLSCPGLPRQCARPSQRRGPPGRRCAGRAKYISPWWRYARSAPARYPGRTWAAGQAGGCRDRPRQWSCQACPRHAPDPGAAPPA